jgi:hypothetical protein
VTEDPYLTGKASAGPAPTIERTPDRPWPPPWPENIYTLTPHALKLYAVMRGALAKSYAPFAASVVTLVDLTGFSERTVRKTRKVLLAMNLVSESPSPGYFLIGPLLDVYRPCSSYPPKTPPAPAQEPPAQSTALLSRRESDTVSMNSSVIDDLNQNLQSGTKTLLSSRKGEVAGISREGRRETVGKVLGILGQPKSPYYVQDGMKNLHRILTEGHTVEEAVSVVRWCRKEYEQGDRFKSLLDLGHVWSRWKFGVYLGAMKVPVNSRKPYSIMTSGPEKDAWHDDYLRKLKARGICPP